MSIKLKEGVHETRFICDGIRVAGAAASKCIEHHIHTNILIMVGHHFTFQFYLLFQYFIISRPLVVAGLRVNEALDTLETMAFHNGLVSS